MNLYKVPRNKEFLEILAEFILSNFNKNVINLDVILHSFHDCLNLRKSLLSKQETAILPNIYPLSSLDPEHEDIYKEDAKKIEVLSALEEKIILADIIRSYPAMSLKPEQALSFAGNVRQMFYELELNGKELLPNVKYHTDESRYPENAVSIENETKKAFGFYDWIPASAGMTPQNLLQYIYHKWQLKLAALKKTSRAKYYKDQLGIRVNRLKADTKNSLIVAGILGDNPVLWQFLQTVAAHKNGFVVLPQIPDIDLKELDKYDSPENGVLFCLNRLTEGLAANCHPKFIWLTPTSDSVSHETMNQVQGDYTTTYPDIFTEAEALGSICAENTKKNIAIIVSNGNLKETYINTLRKYNLQFNDITGNILNSTAAARLIFSVSEILCNQFSLRQLFILLKNPLLYCENVIKLEKLLQRKNRFAKSWQEVLEMVKDNEIYNWIEDISRHLASASITDFGTLLESTIKSAENLCPNLWYGNTAVYLSMTLKQLLKLPELQLQILESARDFPAILKLLTADAKFFDSVNNSADITICRPQDVLLSKYDLVIIPDFNEDSWPPAVPTDPWFNKKTQSLLGLQSGILKSRMHLYYFYSLLHNKRTIITRAKKQSSGAEKLPSDYIEKLQLSGWPGVIPAQAGIQKTPFRRELEQQEKAFGFYDWIPACTGMTPPFPTELSVTDLEMLIRSPYSFYAKKILKLRKEDSIAAPPKLSEFGSFIHNVIEQYSKHYDKNQGDRTSNFVNIGSGIIRQIPLPELTKKIWQIKLSSIAPEFIKFDERRRGYDTVIYSEVPGTMTLEIAGLNIKIKTVADRLELDSKGNAAILDYKTGTLPTKKDIESGLSPQLVIEALIALQDGFGLRIRNIGLLQYVKISSSEPYITTSEINFSKEELHKHKEKLISLLKYYVTNRQFSLEIDLLKYNDYKHLARS